MAEIEIIAIEHVEFEDPPIIQLYGGPESPPEWVWTDEVAEALPQAWLDALSAVIDNPDEVTCAVPGCRATIGFVLVEGEDDRPHGAMHWVTVFLTRVGEAEPVRAVCVDCGHPPVLDIAAETPGATGG